jgi:hypothetical protein
MRFLLALRAIFFVLFLPGSVAGYIPLESSALRTRCVFPTWVRPLSAPPSWSSSASSSFFAVSGTSSRRARALSPPSILRASSSWVASIGSRGTHVQRGFRVIVGEAWLFGSVSLIKYGAAGARPLPPFRRALRGARADVTVRRILQGLPPCCAALGLHDEAISRGHRKLVTHDQLMDHALNRPAECLTSGVADALRADLKMFGKRAFGKGPPYQNEES